MHDQTEKMIKLVCFFTLHADNLAGFIMLSILGQTFLFSGLQLFMKHPYKGGNKVYKKSLQIIYGI